MTEYPATVDLAMKDKILKLLKEAPEHRLGVAYVVEALCYTPPTEPKLTKKVAIQALKDAGMRDAARYVADWI